MLRVVSSFWAISLIMAIVPFAFAQDPEFDSKLSGTWKSDWPLTKKHIDAECKLTKDEISGLERLMGKMTVRYSGNYAVYTMPEIRFTMDGKDRVLEGSTSKEELNVIGRTKSQIAILSTSVSPSVYDDSITLINFIDANTYWVYLGHSPLAGHHVREYFRRVSPK